MSQKIYLAVLEEIYNNVVPRSAIIQFNSIQFKFNLAIIQLHALSLYKKRFISEINSFCIWTQSAELIVRRQGLVWNLEQKVRHDLFHSEPENIFYFNQISQLHLAHR
jgi:hypothetical protein